MKQQKKKKIKKNQFNVQQKPSIDSRICLYLYTRNSGSTNFRIQLNYIPQPNSSCN